MKMCCLLPLETRYHSGSSYLNALLNAIGRYVGLLETCITIGFWLIVGVYKIKKKKNQTAAQPASDQHQLEAKNKNNLSNGKPPIVLKYAYLF